MAIPPERSEDKTKEKSINERGKPLEIKIKTKSKFKTDPKNWETNNFEYSSFF